MSAKAAATSTPKTQQEVCIDLPGESVQCWRSSDNIKVILRKHRDVFFDINLKPGQIYKVESKSEFYSPRDKKLLKSTQFQDGNKFHLWVGRDFKGKLVLKSNDKVMGNFEVTALDPKKIRCRPKDKA